MWIELTPGLLISRVSGPEHDALRNAATDPDQADALADIVGKIAAEWRGGLALVVALSKRPLAVPPEVEIHILADFRFRAFTRLPGMKRFLDDLRVKEWERANYVRDHLAKTAIAPPEDDDLLEGGSAPMTPGIIVPPRVLD